jgi:hypothetical protein
LATGKVNDPPMAQWEGIKGRVASEIKIQNEKLKVAIQKSKFLQLPSESIQL